MALLRQWISDGAPEGEPAAAPEATPEPTASEAEATPVPAVSGEAVTYATLQPIFEQTCGQCHGATPTKGLRLITYEGIMTGSQDGPVIVPGDPDGSKIIAILTGGHFAKLTDEQMAMLRQWISDGAPEGEPEATTVPTEEAPTPEEVSPPADEEEDFVPTLEPTAEPAPAEAPASSGGAFWADTATPSASTNESFWAATPTP
jgi:mono/diheme cytochrome c family protein